MKEYVAIGSRPVGSPGHAKAEQFIKSHLAGDNVEVDSFTAKTPVGEFPIHNIIAKFPGKKDGIIVIAGHYETNYPLPKNFVGANDSGSNTGLMLELANQLRGKPNDGYSVWLLWTDGEEAFVKWTDSDSLYGTKHLAAEVAAGRHRREDQGVPPARHDRRRRPRHPARRQLHAVAQQSGATRPPPRWATSRTSYKTETAVEDDHMPFQKIGVPVVDIIDIDYGYANAYHHTTQDTMDKLSPKSLQIVGDVTLLTIQYINQR